MDIKRININTGGIPTVGFKGDISIIDNIEGLVGYKLPSNYLFMLEQHDGGHPELDTYTLNKNNIFDVSKFYSIENDKYETLEDAISRWGGVLGNGKLPIGRDGGDNQIYLDLTENPPSVWIYLHDESEARVKLASSLNEFIDGLHMDPNCI